MKLSTIACAALSLALSASAWAEDAKPAAAMDMSKMGPWSRKPTNEKQTTKEISEFFKQEEDIAKKGDFEASIARIDFPVFMLTDDSKGVPEGEAWTKDTYVAHMKSFWDDMQKDMKMTHKPSITVLSDSLVNVTDDFTMTMGKQTFSGRSMGVIVKRDGQWKWKTMGEAGWGGMGAAAQVKTETKPTAKK